MDYAGEIWIQIFIRHVCSFSLVMFIRAHTNFPTPHTSQIPTRPLLVARVTLFVMLVGAYPFEDPADPRNFRKTIQVRGEEGGEDNVVVKFS